MDPDLNVTAVSSSLPSKFRSDSEAEQEITEKTEIGAMKAVFRPRGT